MSLMLLSVDWMVVRPRDVLVQCNNERDGLARLLQIKYGVGPHMQA